jgi:hypothetical protein
MGGKGKARLLRAKAGIARESADRGRTLADINRFLPVLDITRSGARLTQAPLAITVPNRAGRNPFDGV